MEKKGSDAELLQRHADRGNVWLQFGGIIARLHLSQKIFVDKQNTTLPTRTRTFILGTRHRLTRDCRIEN